MEHMLKSIVAWLRSAMRRSSPPKLHRNMRHASHAWYAVRPYVGQVDCPEDMEVAIGDLLGDLLHLTDALGVNFYEALTRGEFHHRAEVAEMAELAGR